MAEGDPWITVEEVAARLRMHPDTIRRMLRKGNIRGHRLSRRAGWRIRESEVDRFVEAHGDTDGTNADNATCAQNAGGSDAADLR